MTNWNKHYQENTVTAEEAITHIHNGDTVVFSHAAVEPTHIIRTLLAHADRYQNVEIIHMIGVGGRNIRTTSITILSLPAAERQSRASQRALLM